MFVSTGCTRVVAGQPFGNEKPPGPETLYAGELSTYGQTIDEDTKDELKQARALRRIDPCGYAESLKGVGSVGAYFGNFDGCTVPVKASGSVETWVEMNLVLDEMPYLPPAFKVGSVPVYGTDDGCSFRMALQLPQQGAPRSTSKQPMLKVGDYWSDQDEGAEAHHCDLIKTAATAVAKGLTTDLQVRYATSSYPIKLAERDPCEVLAQYPGQATDIATDSLGSPFGCDFMLGNLDYSVQIIATAKNYTDYQHEERDGITYYYNDRSPDNVLNCHALALLGDAMYGKDPSTGSIRVSDGNDPYYPAVSVASFPENNGDCGKLREILDKAVGIFKNSGR